MLIRSLFILLFFTASISSAVAFPIWETTDADNVSHQYTLITFDGTWDEAMTDTGTLGEGWHLATITSADEQSFLEANTLDAESKGKFWLGAYQEGALGATEGWHWITGEAWDYTNWTNFDVNLDEGGSDEGYLATTSALTWSWDDRLVDGRITGYIAERSGDSVNVPEPGALALFAMGLLGLGGVARARSSKV